jgi:hypothetical protein
MHAVCGYPVKSTWLKAIKAGNYVGWPMLNERNIQKYYPETIETAKGHLNQTRKNVRSTKTKTAPLETCDTFKLHGKKVCNVYTETYSVRETTFSDQTGQFPTRSQRGNKYIMVMVEIDSSAILVEPMKSCKDEEMIRAYNALLLRLKRAGVVPKKHVLDNEVSVNMKNHIRDTCKFEMELAPPGCHRRNAAEVAIRNFKAHFLSVLAGVAEDFSPSLWDRLLPQTEITINLIRQSNATPNVSAYAHLSGPFDYNKMPLAPMGCEAQVHEKTDKRGTWAYHSVDGWYLFTSPEHYRKHNCHIKHSKSERLSNTVQFQHKRITNPTITHADKVMHALANCVKALQGMTSSARNSQAAQDLHRIIEVTKAHVQANPDRLADVATSSTTPNMQRVPRVQTPNMSRVPRVQVPPNVPATNNNDNRRITRSMRAQPSVPRVHKPVTPTNMPTKSAKRERIRKRRVVRLRNAATPTSTSPRAQTRAQVAMAAAQIAPPSMSTRSRVRQANVPPPSRRPGFVAAVMRKQRYQRGMVRLSQRITRLENKVNQAMAVMDADTGKLLNYRQLMRSTKYREAWSLSSANEFGRLANGIGGRIKNPTNNTRYQQNG